MKSTVIRASLEEGVVFHNVMVDSLLGHTRGAGV